MNPNLKNSSESVKVEVDLESHFDELADTIGNRVSLPPYLLPGLFAAAALFFFIFRKRISRCILRILPAGRLRRRISDGAQGAERTPALEAAYAAFETALEKLLAYLLVASFIVPAILTLPVLAQHALLYLLIEKTLFTAYALGLLYKLQNVLRAFFHRRIQEETVRDDRSKLNLLSYLATLSLAVFRVLGFILLLSIWVRNLSTLVAGLGIGGLAFALAAQDTLANIFGSVAIIVARPFELGEWIDTPDLSGTVEQIGLYATRIRSLDDALISIPNSTLAKSVITNSNRRRSRRVEQTVRFSLATDLSVLQQWTQAVNASLDRVDGVIPGISYAYYLEAGERAHLMRVRYLTGPSVDQMLAAKENVNFHILELAAECGAALARFPFPTPEEEKA